jgi:alpha-tubulin suppressor-like RCC1 family protein
MPSNYNFNQDGVTYSFDDVFLVQDIFQDKQLWTWGSNSTFGQLGTNDTENKSIPVTTFAGGTDWKQVSGGRVNTAAIKTDGTLWIWGRGTVGVNATNVVLSGQENTNRSTPVTTFAGGTNWKQVSVGYTHAAAIKTDGTLWTWGSGSNGRLGNAVTTIVSTPVTTFAGETDWKQVSVGNDHTTAIKTDGTLWTWGLGTSRQLGLELDDVTDRSTPVTTFAGGTDWKQVSAGNNHTAAIKTDGTLWTWGVGFALGRDTSEGSDTKSTPITTFAGGTNWADTATTEPEDLYTLSAGTNQVTAIKTDGTLWTWGLGTSGQLGTNDITDRSTPITTFAGGTNWKQVSTGSNHTAAIKTDGTLWTWGLNSNFGILGTNDITDRSTPITTFAGGTDWKQVSAGNNHTAAIKTDGTLWTWGYGTSGQLGIPQPQYFDRYTPVTTFAGGTNWADTATTEPEDLYTLSAGSSYTTAIKTDGTLWTWGVGTSGQLGTNDTTTRSTPVTTFAGGTNWKQVSANAAANHTTAIKTDGTLWTWGIGTNGQLGTNDATTRTTPVTTFAGGTNWKQVSAGTTHTTAIKTDGTLWVWGLGTSGQLGTNDLTQRSTPVTTFAGGTNWKQVSAGGAFTAAIKTDGTLWTWGLGSFGRLGTNDLSNRATPVTTFAGGTNWKQVSAGTTHTTAIKTDGTLWVWGSGTSGRLGTNDITDRSTPVTTFAGGTNWKQVSAGNNFTTAIKTDGTLWTWGLGTSGQLGTNDITDRSTPITTFAGGTNWKQVSTGNTHTIALRDDGVNKELFTWGLGSSGQLGNANNFTAGHASIPVTTFAGGTDWKQVSAGNAFTAAIKTDGTLWTWGVGTSGRLGTFDLISRSTPVTTFAGGTNWKQVSAGAGGSHTTAIKTDGTLWTWGFGASGRLGTFDLISRSTPVTTFAGGSNWKQVNAGTSHTAAIKTDGTLWTWGLGTSGQLGTNDITSRTTPVTTFAGGTNWVQASCAANMTIALKNTGELFTFGTNHLGIIVEKGPFTPNTTFAGGTNWKQVSAGNAFTAAIKTDGTLWTWGVGTSGRLGTFDLISRSTPITTFAGGTDWKQVSAGDSFTAAIKTDGTLWTWGLGTNGQLGTNDLTTRSTPITTFAGGTNWKQVSSGGSHTAAIKYDDYPII